MVLQCFYQINDYVQPNNGAVEYAAVLVVSGSKDKGMTVGKITAVLELYTIGFVVDVWSNMKLLSSFC